MTSQPQLESALNGLRIEIPRRLYVTPPLAQLISLGRRAAGVAGTLNNTPPPEAGPPAPPVDAGPPGTPVPPVEPPSAGGGTPQPPAPPTTPTATPCGCGSGRVIARRPVNFHFSTVTSGGSTTTEMRVYGPIVNPFRIADIFVTPTTPGAPGQLIDILISSDGATDDVTTPTGTSIFPQLLGLAALTAPDTDVGLPAPQTDLRIQGAFQVSSANQFIKVRAYALAPATLPPACHVTLVIEELDLSNVAPTPRIITDGGTPTPPPPPSTTPPATPGQLPAGQFDWTVLNRNYWVDQQPNTATPAAGASSSPPALPPPSYTPQLCVVNGYWTSCPGTPPQPI